ncbi:unnamed protein product [Gongylonema pulchrum]|uniref:Thyroid adenoma-associated protein homolog n=1 Tax=Gongylonema pulchrum TaxID=637853 RepID=A0A183DQI4_9BILA|nr:unnamed protein product [Gongylonema pulchrum]
MAETSHKIISLVSAIFDSSDKERHDILIRVVQCVKFVMEENELNSSQATSALITLMGRLDEKKDISLYTECCICIGEKITEVGSLARFLPSMNELDLEQLFALASKCPGESIVLWNAAISHLKTPIYSSAAGYIIAQLVKRAELNAALAYQNMRCVVQNLLAENYQPKISSYFLKEYLRRQNSYSFELIVPLWLAAVLEEPETNEELTSMSVELCETVVTSLRKKGINVNSFLGDKLSTASMIRWLFELVKRAELNAALAYQNMRCVVQNLLAENYQPKISSYFLKEYLRRQNSYSFELIVPLWLAAVLEEPETNEELTSMSVELCETVVTSLRKKGINVNSFLGDKLSTTSMIRWLFETMSKNASNHRMISDSITRWCELLVPVLQYKLVRADEATAMHCAKIASYPFCYAAQQLFKPPSECCFNRSPFVRFCRLLLQNVLIERVLPVAYIREVLPNYVTGLLLVPVHSVPYLLRLLSELLEKYCTDFVMKEAFVKMLKEKPQTLSALYFSSKTMSKNASNHRMISDSITRWCELLVPVLQYKLVRADEATAMHCAKIASYPFCYAAQQLFKPPSECCFNRSPFVRTFHSCVFPAASFRVLSKQLFQLIERVLPVAYIREVLPNYVTGLLLVPVHSVPYLLRLLSELLEKYCTDFVMKEAFVKMLKEKPQTLSALYFSSKVGSNLFSFISQIK